MSCTDIIPFAFGDNLVRVCRDEKGNPWWVAKDVCLVLDLGNPRSSLALLDADEKGVQTVDTPGGPQEVAIFNEPGLYSLIFRSRKPEARDFRRWVTHEVLPTLRKTGSYSVPTTAAPTMVAFDASPQWPEEALTLKPWMREKLWHDAMQAARLDGGGSDAAFGWFSHLCRLVAHQPVTAHDEVQAFFDECCERVLGKKEKASALYEAFRRWRGSGEVPTPSIRVFGQSMRAFARAHKSNVMVYCDIALKSNRQ